MPLRTHCRQSTMFVACLLAFGSTCALASQTTVAINATIVEVHCTTEQRTPIRAFAAGRENVATKPAKTMILAPPSGSAAPPPGTDFEDRQDSMRPPMIGTAPC
jgi:hypothetical protein